MRILNLTQHVATPEQVASGVEEPLNKEKVKVLLTFDVIPTREQVTNRAYQLARIAHESGCNAAMIGGVGFLMASLEVALRQQGIAPLHSFTRRVVVEETMPDGSVKKTAIFRHEGFCPIPD